MASSDVYRTNYPHGKVPSAHRHSIKMPLLVRGNQSFLFVHAPKCGGSSVVDTFEANGFEIEFQIRGKPPQEYLTVSPQHQSCSVLNSLVRLENISDVFIVARNPYDRVKSEYNWAFREYPADQRIPYSEWVKESLLKASNNLSYADNHFLPVVDFLDPSMPAKIFCLEDGLDPLYEYYIQPSESVQNIKIYHKKKSSDFKYSVDSCGLDRGAIEAINTFYKSDFEAFGYEMIVNSESSKACQKVYGLRNIEASKIEQIKSWRIKTIEMLLKKLKLQIDYLLRILAETTTSSLDQPVGEAVNYESKLKSLQRSCEGLALRTALMNTSITCLLNTSNQQLINPDLRRITNLLHDCRDYVSRVPV